VQKQSIFTTILLIGGCLIQIMNARCVSLFRLLATGEYIKRLQLGARR
jgi:hypothetical protein